MNTSELLSKRRFKSMQATRLLLLADIFTFLVFASSLFFSWNSYKDLKKVLQQTNNITELKGTVLHYDEILTMSAKMASVTGDLYWEERYNNFKVELDLTLKKLITVIPEMSAWKSAKKTQIANEKLVKMEKQAFEAVKRGRLGEAQSLLTDSAYKKQKEVYTEGMLQVGKDLDEASEKMIKKQKSQLIILIGILFIAIPFLIITWLITYRKFKVLIKKLTSKNQQLDAHNQQLQATEQQLRAANQQLTSSEEEIKKQTHKLNERLQELKCLHSISESVRTRETLEEILQDATEVIPPSWQYPQITCSKITLWDKEYKAENYEDTRWKLSSDIRVNKNIAGKIEVCYLEKTPENDIGPFLNEERILLDDIAERLGRIIERKNAEEKLKATNQQLLANNQQLSATEQQLRANNQQLIASEKALRESESKLNAAQHIANIGDFSWNVITGEVTWSDGMYKLLKYDKDEKIDLADVNSKIHHPDDLDKITKWLNDCLASGKEKLEPNEYRIVRKDGKVIFVHTEGVITYENGKAVSVFGMCQDITERKKAEEALRESEEKFRKSFSTSPDSINISRLEDGMYISINDGFTRITGYSESDVIGKTSLEINIWLNSDDREKFAEELRKNGQVQNLEVQFRMKNGKVVYGLVSSTVITLNGVPHIISITRDITKRKLVEAKLEENEKKYRELSTLLHLMADNMPDMLWAKNLNKEFVFVNKAICTGLLNAKDTDEPLGKTDMFFATRERKAHPDNPEWHTFGEICKDSDAATLEELKPMNFDEFGNVRGKFLFLDVHKAPLYDSDGQLIGVVGSARDVTAAKEAENQLRKLSTAVTQSPSVISITDTKGNIEYVNPKFTEITGYSLEEVIGKNPRILKSEEQPHEMYKELWQTITSGKVWRGEFHNKKKNGELFWTLSSISPIFDEKGKIINYVDVAEDITDQKQAENNFRHSIDESPLGIRIVTQTGKTIYVNKALLDIYEFSSLNEFNNTKTIDRYTEKSYQEHQERKKIRQEGGFTSDYEISIRRKNGEIRHVEVWRKEVIWNKEKHFQVINQDITELKRLTTDLILAKEKAEESNRLKTAFLNNMSHEIRTPLNGITGFIGLLQNTEVDDEAKQKYFDIINKSSDRLITTVTDIIDISRIEAGEVKVSKSEVSANEILEEQYKFFYQEAKSKGIELNYKPSLSDREARFVTDKHKLEGILTNLIKNAIKFTETGSITFGYAIKNSGEKDIVEFYVKDTGIGIPANRVDAIFNRFEQADIADTRAFQGSGLGLAISKSYVEMLGGKISVKSIEGEGSTFTFSIPCTKQLVKESHAIEYINKEPQKSLSHLSLIIVEDDEVSRLFLQTILENKFNKVIYTATGKEAIDKCRVNPETDIILMDIKMPDMNGYDATREIRKFNKDVVIIAQTAFGLSGDRKKALEAGCNDYISKPIIKEELFEKMEACVNKKNI